ncbi:putative glycosyl hydrolase, family 18 [Leptodontidium sp. 2 PMI_412]|nr:putative glycosyl hydrolase, family 18 [Leptodontidium sp. 2 PMI_412]
MRSLQRKAIGLALFATFSACASVEVVHLDSSAFLDLRDKPVVDQTLKEFQEATERTPNYLLEACPSSCTDLKAESEWFLYSDAARLNLCNETLLMGFALEHDLKSNNDKTAIKACKADYGVVKEVDQSLETAAVCPTPNHVQVSVSVKVTSYGSSEQAATGALAAVTQVNNYVSSQPILCNNNTISFGYSSGAVVGLYSGKEIHHQGVTAQLLRKVEAYLQKGSVSQGVIVQLCNSGGRGADYAIGIAASLSGDLSFVQTATKAWKDGKCMPGGEEGATLTQLRFNVPDTNSGSSKISNSTESTRRSIDNTIFRSRLTARADCKTTKVAAGDGCFAVAARCGISQADLTKYNPRTNFCSTLAVDEIVCCSSGTLPDTTLPPNADGTCQTRTIVSGDSCSALAAKCGITPAQFTTLNPSTTLCSNLAPGGIVCCGRGKLPDITPKPNSDGSCFVYQTKKDDSCSVIAASRGLTVAKVEEFNKNTWGWNGCELLWVGVNMCLSTGTPPMPAPVSNAVCGPTVPGTQKPASLTNLAGLNPCPLKVCCNIWGQCGTTADFCVISKSTSGAPGTAAPGSNGCIANCGMDIVSSGPPAMKVKVAYFESWNWGRPCLHMHVDSINTATYTHIHFAFGNITSNFQVDVSGAQDEFDRFKKMTGIKKIISFGGWAFSTEPGTFKILREATKAANRNTFVTNLVNFVTSNGLDGIDLDWEYPGAPDIPDIPSGDPVEGMDYYNTLVQLKSKLGSGKSVSFAAPASYWYLKAFPIELMGAALDYIIYMTYDLHGQWDYGNKWTSPGCPTGNCLRSHVNLTETTNALSMITKAGVPSNKVVVGVASYGRSFKMAQAGCTGPACLFTGSARVSNAAKGECTQTGGYISNAEIQEIIGAGGVQQYVVEDSDILVYGGGTEWVSYMKDTTKAGRETLYAKYNFAGTTDWAVDLQAYTADEEYAEEDDPLYGTYEEHVSDSEVSQCSSKYRSLDQLEKDADKIPSDCMATYIVGAEAAILGDALDSYDTLIKGKYDKKFEVYQRAMIEQIPLQIYQYMAGAQKSGFFQCTETKIQCCRSKCTSGLGCSADCSTAAGCQTGKVAVKVDCPTTLAYPYVATYTAQPNITYTCTNMDGFYKDISDKYGIDRSWLTWSDRRVQVQTGCSGSGKKAEDCLKLTSHYWYNYPAPVSNIQIPNPKSVIGGRYNEMRALKARMESQSTNADIFSVSRMDIADSGSLPALMMQFAITNMNQVIETANKILEQERKNMILSFVTAFLMFIPLAGGAAGSIGGGLLRTIINIGGELGNLAVGIYSVVDEPGNALVTIFGMLLGGVNVRPFKEIATYRRNIKSEDLNQLGPIKKDLDRIDTLKAKGKAPSCGIR